MILLRPAGGVPCSRSTLRAPYSPFGRPISTRRAPRRRPSPRPASRPWGLATLAPGRAATTACGAPPSPRALASPTPRLSRPLGARYARPGNLARRVAILLHRLMTRVRPRARYTLCDRQSVYGKQSNRICINEKRYFSGVTAKFWQLLEPVMYTPR